MNHIKTRAIRDKDIMMGNISGDSHEVQPLEGSKAPIPIAICGMAMRLPGGISNGEQLWDFLIQKKDARARVPMERYNSDAFHGSEKHGYFITDCDLARFDASLFRVSRLEVEQMDPQQRILLELTRECFETAGETNWRGKSIGCYIGTWGDDWKEYRTRDKLESEMSTVNGHSDFMMANKISYEYDLRGPSMVVKTACSSSLVALERAFRDLQSGNACSALVGGANMLLSPSTTTAMYQGGLLSPNDSCRTFDANADGYARGEAVNMVFLKRLDHAVRDGNPIRAVLRSVVSNHNGEGDAAGSMYYPSSRGQETLVRACYKDAGIIDFGKTAHFECHGTGTPAGDPIETIAIANIWSEYGGISIGSSKPNFGHSEGASGLTSLIKSVLALEAKIIPPNIKFESPNPKVPFEKGLVVPVTATAWPQGRHERISINSFGLGGSNAHAILDSAASFGIDVSQPEATTTRAISGHKLLLFSANHSESTMLGAQQHANFVENNSAVLDNIAYTMACRREHLPWRTFAVTDGTGLPEFTAPVKPISADPKIVLVFTGQGAQWPAMGARLLANFPSVVHDIGQMEAALATLGEGLAPNWSLIDELVKHGDDSRIRLAEFSQPLSTAVQILIINLLRSWGLQSSAVVGHSSGEIAAAYACGAISMPDAILLSYARGLASNDLRDKGGMVAVGLGRDEVQSHLSDGLAIACENSPKSTTLSGDEDKVSKFVNLFAHSHPHVLVRRLKVDKPYHSPLMQAVGGIYEDIIAPRFKSTEPDIPFYSTVLNKRIEREEPLDSHYWRRNMESPVLFHTALEKLLEEEKSPSGTILLEIGPHSALSGPIHQILKGLQRNDVAYIPTLIRNKDEVVAILSTVGQLFLKGANVHLDSIFTKGTVLPQLPTYPWHRDGTFWREARLVTEWKLRRFPHHELLGSLVVESSKSEPTWRNLLSVEKLAWLKDHMIERDVVLPGAAYIVMACEAVRQVSEDEPDDYSLRNIVLNSAMVLSELQKTETIFNLRPLRLTNSLDSQWYEFSVSSYNGTMWKKHCIGQIKRGSESLHSKPRKISELPRIVNTPSWYQVAHTHGMHFGPRFQGLKLGQTTAHPLENLAVAHVSNRISDVIQPEVPSYLHAITIDYCLQLFPQSALRGLSRNYRGLKVPTYFGEVYVQRPRHGNEITFEVASVENSKGDLVGSGLGIDNEGQIVLELRNTRLSTMGDDQQQSLKDSFRVNWKPHMDFAQLDRLIVCNRSLTRREECYLLQRLTLLCCLEMQYQLAELKPTTISHMEDYHQWINHQVQQAITIGYPLVADAHSLSKMEPDQRISYISTVSGELQGSTVASLAEAICRVCSAIKEIYSGVLNGLDILRDGDLLTRVYNLTDDWDFKPFLSLLSHRTPHLRVLEIGAGTGATTSLFLKSLVSEEGTCFYESYVFSDISAGFFSAARERFRSFQGVHFQTLDITRDPVDQGFEPASFHLIVAANVLHATPCLKTSLANIRKLLLPNGKLVLQELHSSMKAPNIVTGILPGWWMGKADGRMEEPYVSPSRWIHELSETGFSTENTMVALDDKEPFQTNAVIVASPLTEDYSSKHVTLLSSDKNGPVALSVSNFLKRRGLTVNVTNTAESTIHNIISIIDFEGKPLLENITRAEFQTLKTFFLEATGNILWVTKPCQVMCSEPEYATCIGLMRVLQSELQLDIATLEIDAITTEAGLDAIYNVYHHLQTSLRHNLNLDRDREFALWQNKICIPRFQWFSVDKELSVQQPEWNGRAVRQSLDIEKRGSLKSLTWVSKLQDDLEAGEVLVEMRAVGVNFKDILGAMGIVEGTPGLEGAGVIRQVGHGVSSLRVGDRVGLVGSSLYTTMAKANSEHCFKLPDDLDFESAATIPSAFCTALYSLLDLAKVEAGQRVLIHSACGGTGLAALQISQMVGAEIYATVGSDEKVKFLHDNYGIPKHRIFNSRDSSFLPGVLAATGGQGVHVVLNSLSGELLHDSWKCVAEFGCMVELGKRDFIGQGRLAMEIFEKNRSFFGVDMTAIYEKRPHLMAQILNRVTSLYHQGLIQPIAPMMTYNAADIEAAFREMQKGRHMGKFVVKISSDAALRRSNASRPPLIFSSESSYLLAGGLGGLGRSVSIWMVERGAKNLIYLSRSAGEKLEHASFMEELSTMGCTAQVFPGSVGNIADVENAVRGARLPIAGVLQMSMVLKDRMFENMSYEEWTDVITPKVQGTVNLHKALQGHNLDFFVIFSSSTGVAGYQGQSNYAAGGAFQDAFVQAKHSQGQPASVIDVGPVDDVGYLLENPQILSRLRNNSIYFVHERGLLDGLELAIKTSAPTFDEVKPNHTTYYKNPSQFCLGFRTTLPLTSPNNRVPWKNDPRCAPYRNLDDVFNDSLANGLDTDGHDEEAAFKAFMFAAQTDARSLVEDKMTETLARLIGVTVCGFMMKSTDELDVTGGFVTLGVDSLVAVELKNWFSQRMALDVSVLEIMEAASIMSLASMVIERLLVKLGDV